jgi:hypothetical protein
MANDIKKQDGFIRTFSVDLSRDAVWEAVCKPTPGNDGNFVVPGFEAVCSALEITEGEKLRVLKEEEPCKGTEIIIELVDQDTGTRVTVSQSGFGPWLPDLIEVFGCVWNMIVADLKLAIESGVQIKTHLFGAVPPAVSLGCVVTDNISGLLVTTVEEDTFASRSDLLPGDLIVRLNGARVMHNLQLADLLRMCAPGNELEVEWVRDGVLCQSSQVI